MSELMRAYQKSIARVRAHVASPHGTARSALASMAGMSVNALRGMDRPDWKPTVQTLERLLAKIDELEAERKSRRPSRRPERAPLVVA